jgi:hypothetical protein
MQQRSAAGQVVDDREHAALVVEVGQQPELAKDGGRRGIRRCGN